MKGHRTTSLLERVTRSLLAAEPRRKAARRRLQRLVLPFVVILPITLLLGWSSMEFMSAIRAYIVGEAVSARSQEDAVEHLSRYAESGRDADYRSYQEALALPLGNRRAREALLHADPDPQQASAGLLAGGSDPADVPRMIWAFRLARDLPVMQPVVDAWTASDALVDELAALGERLHRSASAGPAAGPGDRSALAELRALDSRLRPLHEQMARSLGELYRTVHGVLFVGVAGTTLLLLALAWLAMRRALERTLQVERDLALSEREVSAQRERAEVTLRSIGDAVVAVHQDGTIDYLNPMAEALTGWTDEEARDRPLADVVTIVYEDTGDRVPDPVRAVISESRALRLRRPAALIRRDGSEVPISESSAPITSPEGTVTGVVIVFRDVSRERRLAAQLTYQASHDALTGLLNRREFERRLEEALLGLAVHTRHHALLYVDLDQFKVVNDTCGHAAGDELIRQVAGILGRHLRDSDTLARLGGDEFGVLLENCSLAAAVRIAEDIRRRVDELRFSRDGRSFAIGASIGVVPLDACPATVRDALAAADRACYLAKDGGRNRVCVYRGTEDEYAVRRHEMQWVSRVHGALDEERFELYCQPIGALREGRGGRPHVEVLVRMRDESGLLIPPGLFIPAAERYGLMPRLDRWVVSGALALLGRQRKAHRELPVCVLNLSAATLSDPALGQFVLDQFARYAVPFDAVCFELTETAAVSNLVQAGRFMGEMRARGCTFSLDDFGAGMSSFGYLRTLPVDFIKVDGSFVRNIVSDPVDAAMVEAINRIGHVMGKRTIAEMVENDDTREALRRLGVDYAQGYAIAEVEPLARYLEKMPRRESEDGWQESELGGEGAGEESSLDEQGPLIGNRKDSDRPSESRDEERGTRYRRQAKSGSTIVNRIGH